MMNTHQIPTSGSDLSVIGAAAVYRLVVERKGESSSVSLHASGAVKLRTSEANVDVDVVLPATFWRTTVVLEP